MSIDVRRNPDREHLNLLGIFHYVLAGMNAFSGCMPIFHVAFGVAMLSGAFDGGPNPPPPMVGLLFATVGGGFMLIFWTLALLKLLAGRWLRSQQHYRFCYVVACLDCVQMPWGTVLGVFTIMALSRPSVKILFEGIEPRLPRDLEFDEYAFDDPPNAAQATDESDDGSVRSGPPAR